MRIKLQLIFTFSILLFIIGILGINVIFQTNILHKQTETMYNHPLQIRRAISTLEKDLLNIELTMKSIELKSSILEAKKVVEVSGASINNQFEILDVFYLGDKKDVTYIKDQYYEWIVYQNEVIRYKIDNEIVPQNVYSNLDLKLVEMRKGITIVDEFARNKADSLYNESNKISERSSLILVIATIFILLLTVAAGVYLNGVVQKPLDILIQTAVKFQTGDRNARASYNINNEFGDLTKALNELIESVQVNMELEEKKVELSSVMVHEVESKKFFDAVLNYMMQTTGAQVASVFLLSDDGLKYNHFHSIGLSEKGQRDLSVDVMKEEIGSMDKKGKLHRLVDIPEESRFVNFTAIGDFSPKDIITIPVQYQGSVTVLITFASIRLFEKSSIDFIESNIDVIEARTEGIMALSKSKEVSLSLEVQNRELDIQKNEMEALAKELRQQNIELEVQKNQLTEVNKLKTNFLSNMSHELRTPLNSVITLSGVLYRKLEGEISEKEHGYLEIISRNGKNLLLLINDILDISRIESGKQEFSIQTFDLIEVIKDQIDMIRPQVDESVVQLELEQNPMRLTIKSDEQKVRHVIQNLLSNAVKFTHEGRISVIAEIENKDVILQVIDTGIGISQSNLKHVFDEFRQSDGSTSRRYGGTGLGLSIAQKYTNLLGGDIHVESKLGEGTLFKVKLPLEFMPEGEYQSRDEIDQLRIPKKTKNQNYKHEGKKKILIVEDSESAVIQLQEILEDDIYDLDYASNGLIALEKINESIPDGIILDLMMSYVDGFDVIESLRKNETTSDVPVLVLTAKHITAEDAVHLTDHKVHQLIQKGDVNKDELLHSVSLMLGMDSFIGRQENENSGITDNEIIEKYREKARNKAKKNQLIHNKEGKTPLVRSMTADKRQTTILIVEDNPDNMITVKALLESEYNILEAVDGYEGVRLAKEFHPDLILMDIALPGIDGIEAFHRIQKHPSLQNTPVFALTASALLKDRESILAHGFTGFLSKPIIEDEFAKAIKGALYG